MIRSLTKKVTSSSIIINRSAVLLGMQIGTDGANDPTITVYNGTSNSGYEVVPSNTYDASALGLNGYIGAYGKLCSKGIYVEITCAGTVEVVIDYISSPGG